MAEKQQFKQRLLNLQGNLYNFACQLTSNREAAQDLVQDTTLKVLDNEAKYVDNVNFKGWVFTIMRNIFINNYRRQVRSSTVIDTTEDLYHLNLSQGVRSQHSRRLFRSQGDLSSHQLFQQRV